VIRTEIRLHHAHVRALEAADTSSSLTEIVAIGIFLNALLAVFNLIPIPPLDGSRVVQYSLSGETLALYRRIERFGLLIIMGAVFFIPQLQLPLSEAIAGLVRLITTPFGVTAVVEPALRSARFG
jgi:Zn-dependent protease